MPPGSSPSHVDEGPVPVQIVVPLSRDGRSLGAASIEIFDTVTGQRIAAVPLAPTPAPRPTDGSPSRDHVPAGSEPKPRAPH